MSDTTNQNEESVPAVKQEVAAENADKEAPAEPTSNGANEDGNNKEKDVKDESTNDEEGKANGGIEQPNLEDAKNIYAFTVKDIDGNEVSLEKYRGHPTLVVNVASNCGFTRSNYNQLNQLYAKYKDQGLKIAAFPCNQFMNQESACDVDIKEFAKKNNVEFDMYAKINVNGADAIPLYKWLKNKQKGILGFNGIKWNFTKFLVDKEGVPIRRYAPTTSPNAIEPEIKALLA